MFIVMKNDFLLTDHSDINLDVKSIKWNKGKKKIVDYIRIQESENITTIETTLDYLLTQDRIDRKS